MRTLCANSTNKLFFLAASLSSLFGLFQHATCEILPHEWLTGSSLLNKKKWWPTKNELRLFVQISIRLDGLKIQKLKKFGASRILAFFCRSRPCTPHTKGGRRLHELITIVYHCPKSLQSTGTTTLPLPILFPTCRKVLSLNEVTLYIWLYSFWVL